MLNPPVNGKIQGFFKALECFSSTFQGKFNFQGLHKTVLYIQVLFKPVQTLITLPSLASNNVVYYLSLHKTYVVRTHLISELYGANTNELSRDVSIRIHQQYCINDNGVARTLKVMHIKGRLLDKAVILFNCVPFRNRNFS